jgi:RHS repeat-associated protein
MSGRVSYCGEVGNWQYDAFGNRLQEAYAIANGASCTAASGTSTQMTSTPQSSANNNQLASTVVTYDQAGNAYYDGRNSYLYDGEGRLCAVKDGATNYQYLYDASGTRVAKGTSSSWPAVTITNGVAIGDLCATPTSATFTLTNQYLLDLSGDQVTELTGTGAWVHSNAFTSGRLTATYDSAQPGVHYAFADPLGTKRIQEVITSNGTAAFDERCISLPFGNDIPNSNLPNCQGPGIDATEHHFTGKERDAESGNDYFGARYYSSAMGRFTTPDWSAKVVPVPYAQMGDPQSLNLYAYVRNNPIIRVDADGHKDPCDINVTTVKVVQPGTGSITLDGQPQYGVVGGAKFQVTQGGKPLVGAPVSESNTTTRTVNGKPEPGQPHPKSTKTGPDGGVPDLIGDTKNTDGSAASTAAAKSFYDTSTVVSVTDQILTVSAPGCTASFTDTRTVTSTPGQAPTITVTDPKPVPPPPPPPKPKTP